MASKDDFSPPTIANKFRTVPLSPLERAGERNIRPYYIRIALANSDDLHSKLHKLLPFSLLLLWRGLGKGFLKVTFSVV